MLDWNRRAFRGAEEGSNGLRVCGFTVFCVSRFRVLGFSLRLTMAIYDIDMALTITLG